MDIQHISIIADGKFHLWSRDIIIKIAPIRFNKEYDNCLLVILSSCIRKYAVKIKTTPDVPIILNIMSRVAFSIFIYPAVNAEDPQSLP